MAGIKLYRFIRLLLILISFHATQSFAGLGAESKCDGGFYFDASGTCTSCASPPDHNSINFNIYCEGLCVTGHWGLNCDRRCGHCVNRICTRWTGHCVHPCLANYHGTTCNIFCPNCTSCDESGKCTCSKGNHGDRCQETCPETCKDKTCTSTGICNQGCTRGWVGERCDTSCVHCLYRTDTDYICEQGWFGAACDQQCNDHCPGALCDRDGRCTEGCTRGLWGSRCETQCPQHCADSSCDRVTGLCVRGCEPGKSGGRCEEDCPSACATGCLMSGSCRSCPYGSYGATCMQQCPHCNMCHKEKGDCLTCPVGYFGNKCQLQCKNCLDGCSIDGSCAACKEGWFGDSCSKPCSPGCGHEVARGCSRQSGYCNGGCGDGWYDFRCDRMCPSGCKYGRCGPDGTCKDGCKMTMYGAYCNYTCSSNCIYSYCDVSEGSQQLVCRSGCQAGKSGLYCQDDHSFVYPLFHVFIAICLVVATFLCGLCLSRKMRNIYKRRNRRVYISPYTDNTADICGQNATYRSRAEVIKSVELQEGYDPVGIAGPSFTGDFTGDFTDRRNDLRLQGPSDQIRCQDPDMKPMDDQHVTDGTSPDVPDQAIQVNFDMGEEEPNQPSEDAETSNLHEYFAIPESYFE